jgi:RsiW-degrading membrane proteinase PrsW (M82 family)
VAKTLLSQSKAVDRLQQLQQIDRSQNIESWNVRLYFLSRNRYVLMGFAAAVIAISFGIAWVVKKPLRAVLGFDKNPTKALQTELAEPKPEMEKVLELMPKLARSWRNDDAPAGEWITKSALSEPEKLVAQAYWVSLQDWSGFEPSADLLYYAHYVRPLRFANELLGDHYAEHDQFAEAAAYYRREGKIPEAKKAREKLLELLITQHDEKQLRELGKDPLFTKDLRPEHRLYLAAVDHRWISLWEPLRDLQIKIMQPLPMVLAAVAGLAWFLVALQAIQPPMLISFRVFAPISAVLLGMASILPTLMTDLWMEETLGLRHSEDAMGNFVFFLGSVGLREELCKLALTLPLLIVCLARKSRLEALICAGCVGLGFAIWENLQYFAGYGAAVAFPRFLTANFFHFALTGINGLALFDFVREPARGAPRFFLTLAGTIAAHGLYDFLASVPGMPLLVRGSIIIFVLVCLYFFRTLRTLRDGSTDQFSIAGTFVIGISVLMGTILIIASQQIGLLPAVVVLAFTGLSMMLVGSMFYRQLGEGMSLVEETRPSI